MDVTSAHTAWGAEGTLAKDPYLIGKAKICIHGGLVPKPMPLTTNYLSALHIGILVTAERGIRLDRR